MNIEMTFDTRDEFKRKPVAEKILKLLKSDIDVSPMVIDGPWGSGKTEFCQKFIHLVTSTDSTFRCLYLDTYKFDHSDDPLLMLVTGISSLLKDGAKKEGLLKKSIPVVKVLSKVAGQAAVGWLLKSNAENLKDEFTDAISNGSDELLDLGIKRIFKDYEAIEENLKLFKESLQEIAAEKPLIILLDELDRCRPSFALSLLEKIKHVFDVPGIKFVFTANLVQLEAIVKKQYGFNINSEKYLSKFFNLVIRLPSEFPKDQFTYKKNSTTLFRDLVKTDDQLKKFLGNNAYSYEVLEHLFVRDNVSLRDIERYFRNIKILLALDGENSIKEDFHWFYGTAILIAVYVYTFDSDFTLKMLNQAVGESELSQFFGLSPEILKRKKYDNSVDVFYIIFLLYWAPDDPKIKMNEEDKKFWDDFIKHMFGSLFRTPSKEDKLPVMRKTIKDLQLL